MFEFVDIDEYLSKIGILDKDEEHIAFSVISPTQTAHAVLKDSKERVKNDEYNVYHNDIFNYIVGEIYDIEREIDMSTKEGREKKSGAIFAKFIQSEEHFVCIRYVINEIGQMATLEIPAYITEREFDELTLLNEKLKLANLDIGVTVTPFNPSTSSIDWTIKDNTHFVSSKNDALDKCLEFMEHNGRIVDYNLPFEDVNDLSVKEKKIA